MKRPLDGIKVVELTTMITGPLAGMLLGDLGAEVVKIENRETGDPFRHHHGGQYGGYFLSYNRNKRSLTLDLRNARGRDILLKLIGRSDVLIDNFRPGVMERLGLTPDVLEKANPRLIHASITGFGADGPYRERPAYDAVAQALSGMLSQFLVPDSPQITGPTLSDNITGYYTAYGVLAALFERERTDKGRRIEANMLEATAALAPDGFVNSRRHGMQVGPLTRVSTSQSYAFQCADGRLIAIHLSSPTKFWEGLLAAAGRQDLAGDPRFAERSGRIANYVALAAELAKTFRTKPRDHWAKRLEAEDVPYAPVLNVEEVFDDPQVRHLETFFRVEHPREGEIWGVNNPVRFDGARLAPVVAPPVLGEHTAEVLAEIGFTADEIATLKEMKVV